VRSGGAHRRVMTTAALPQVLLPGPFDPLRLAAAPDLARFKGQSRRHTESDLRAYWCWCAERGLDPLAAARPHIELYVRWMQEQRRYAASTVSRRMAVVAGLYRTCVIDGGLQHSPAEYVRRPNVPAQSPTLGLSHLQFEAILTAARESANQFDFALVCLLGLLGLRIFEATGLDITDLGEEHGHRVLRVLGKGHKIVLVPLPVPCRNVRSDVLARHRFVDETYVKVAGRWTYLYRAIDQHGHVIDVLVSERRDGAAAWASFTRALTKGPAPAELTTDRAPVYRRVIDELAPTARHVLEQYANNSVCPWPS
jgi:integrase